MKKVLLVISILFIAACSPSAEVLNFPVLPAELKDCKFYRVSDGNLYSLRIVRCPNSTTATTYSEGKTTSTTVVIDGIEYVKKENNDVR